MESSMHLKILRYAWTARSLSWTYQLIYSCAAEDKYRAIGDLRNELSGSMENLENERYRIN